MTGIYDFLNDKTGQNTAPVTESTTTSTTSKSTYDFLNAGEPTPVTTPTNTSPSILDKISSAAPAALEGAYAPFKPIVNDAIEAGTAIDEAGSSFLKAIANPELGSAGLSSNESEVGSTALNTAGTIAQGANSPFTTVVKQGANITASQTGVKNPEGEWTPELKQEAADAGNLATLPFALPDAVKLASGVGSYAANLGVKVIDKLAQDAPGVVKVPESVSDFDKLPINDYIDRHVATPDSVDFKEGDSFGAYADHPNPAITTTNNVAATSQPLATQTGTTPATVTAVTAPNAPINVAAPNVIQQVMNAPTNFPGLGASAVKDATEGAILTFRNNVQNEFTVLNNLNRSYGKLTGISQRGDALIESDMPYITNVSQRAGHVSNYWIGDGETPGIKGIQRGTTKLVDVPNVNSETYDIQQALKADPTLTIDDIRKVERAGDAMDDYANIGRTIQTHNTTIASNILQINQLRAVRNAINPTSFMNKYAIQKDIDTLINQNKTATKAINDLSKTQSHMTQADASTILAQHQNNPAMQAYIKANNARHSFILDQNVIAGRLTDTEANRLRQYHPNYTPVTREVDDYTVHDSAGYNSTGNADLKKRDISSVGKDQINVHNNKIYNYIDTARRNDAAMTHTAVLDNLMKITDDAGWQEIFREPKADVMKALNSLSTTDKPHFSAIEVTPPSKTRVENYTPQIFYKDGKSIELSVKNKNIYNTLAGSTAYAQPDNAAWLFARRMALLKRDMLITYDPSFAIRNAKRGAMDFLVNANKVTIGKDYIPIVSQMHEIANTFFKPDEYQTFASDYGLGHDIDTLYQGKTKEQIADITRTGAPVDSALSKVHAGLADYNTRIDAGIRMLQYKIMYNKLVNEGMDIGKAHDAAMFAAKDAHLNFYQQGANSSINSITQLIPLSRTFLSATDKSMRMAMYAPKTMAMGMSTLYALHKGNEYWNSQFKDTDGVPFADKLDPNIKDHTMVWYYGNGVNKYTSWNLGWVWGETLPALQTTGQYLYQKGSGLIDALANHTADKVIADTPELSQKITSKQLVDAWANRIFAYATPSSATPPVIGATAGLYFNQDDMGHPIVPQSKTEGAPFTQYYASKTDPSLINLARDLKIKYGIDISPAKLDFVSRALGGSVAQSSIVAGAHAYAYATGTQLPAVGAEAIPGYSLVSGDNSNVPHESVESQYNNIWGTKLEPIQKQAASLKAQAELHPETAPIYTKFVDAHAYELHSAAIFSEANKTLSQLNAAYDRVIGDKADDPKASVFGSPEKRIEADQLKMHMIQIQRSVIHGLVQDADDNNYSAESLYDSRLSTSTGTKFINKLIPDQKKLDKPINKEYNSPVDSAPQQIFNN